jgi:hypothetical protein
MTPERCTARPRGASLPKAKCVRTAMILSHDANPKPDGIFGKDNPLVFGPEATRAMSVAFDEVCRALNLSHTANGVREVIAIRIIELARRGECDSDRLRDRVITEAGAAGSGSLG